MQMATLYCRTGAWVLFFLFILTPSESRADSTQVQNPDPAEMMARIDALTRKVEELSRQVEALMSVNAAKPAQTAGNAVIEKAAARTTDAPAASKPAEQIQNEDRLLRFSGDFRLRLDGTLRPAYSSVAEGQSALPHVQNIRARYRLRLNFDTNVHPMVSFHGQLTTGPANNQLTLDQDFTAVTLRHPFQVNEAWVNFHPAKWAAFHGGRVQEVFADYNQRFLFDDDITFNGFNQRLTRDLKTKPGGFRRIELRAGQYIFTNPNIAVVSAGNLGPAGAIIGSTGRAAQMFHQGLIVEQGIYPKASHTFGADLQIYRNPNQIQFSSTSSGFPILVQNGLGVALSGPVPGTGNATTTPGGAVYTARNFHVARLFYRFDYEGFRSAHQEYPVMINFQVSRNIGTGASQRDGLLASFRIGRVEKALDFSIAYMFATKGANSMISQLTDDDLGTITGVNIRSHHFRFDLGLAKKIQLQSLFFTQRELSNSGQYPNFFVPVNAYTPRLYRFQEQLLFLF